MDRRRKKVIFERIADGDKLFFSPDGRFWVWDEGDRCYRDAESGEIGEDTQSLGALPFLNLKEEALRFIEENRNLYRKRYLSLLHKTGDAREAAWKLLIDLDDEGEGEDWADFCDYRNRKAERILDEWMAETFRKR